MRIALGSQAAFGPGPSRSRPSGWTWRAGAWASGKAQPQTAFPRCFTRVSGELTSGPRQAAGSTPSPWWHLGQHPDAQSPRLSPHPEDQQGLGAGPPPWAHQGLLWLEGPFCPDERKGHHWTDAALWQVGSWAPSQPLPSTPPTWWLRLRAARASCSRRWS